MKKQEKRNSPSAELNYLSLLPCWQCNICVGVQQLSLAVSSNRHHAFNVRMYACLYPPITSVKRHVTSHKKLFLLLFTYAGTAQAERRLRSLSHPILSHPLIHLPPLCSVSLPPTTHHLLRPIITRSTSPLQLPWQQLCWAQVPVSPVVTGLPLTITIYCIKIKLTNHFYMA